MKKLALMMVTSLAVACGGGDGGDDDNNDSTTKVCTANAKVDCSTVAGKNYVAGVGKATCNASGTGYSDETQCVAQQLVAEGEACTGTSGTQGNCEGTLKCIDFGSSVGKLCAQPCTPGPTPGCDAQEYCFEYATGQGVCQALSDTGGVCFTEDASDCLNAGSGEECIPVWTEDGTSFVGVCTKQCDGAQVGHGASTCTGGQVCLANPSFVDVQQAGTPAANKACTEATQATDCDTANGYECLELSSGFYCSRPMGMCGELLPLRGTQTSVGDDIGEEEACDETGFPRGDNLWCGVTGVPAGTKPAFAFCAGLTQDGIGVCIGICEDDIGTVYGCGTGYSCSAPAVADAFFFKTEKTTVGGTTAKICTGASDTTCGAGYACNELSSGWVCSTPLKVCQ